MNATLQEVRERETGFVEGQSVVVIGRSNLPSTAETELDFIECVATDLSKNEKGLRVIPADEFRDVVFPWFEPRVEPERSAQLAGLLNQPRLAAQLDSIDLRYLVWIDGRTSRTSSAGSLGCAVGPGGGGCFGFLTGTMTHPTRQLYGMRRSGKRPGGFLQMQKELVTCRLSSFLCQLLRG